MDKLIVNRNWH